MKFQVLPLFLLALWVGLAAEPVPSTPASPTSAATKAGSASQAKLADPFAIAAKYTNSLTLEPGADDARIAKTVVRFLGGSHYTRRKFDSVMGRKMFDRYLDSLDPQKLYLLQSDLAEFSQVRTNLDDITLRQGDTSAAYDIFNRFLKRYDESYALAMEHLKNGKFSFTGDESFLVNRKESPRPKDLAEAHKLWNDRLSFEYLAEKLNEGDRSATLAQFTTHLKNGTYDRLTSGLTNKFSPEKSADLTAFARKHYEESASRGRDKAIVAAVDAVSRRLDADVHEEIVRKLARRYQRTLRNLKQFEADEVLQLWLDAMGHAYDPHTDYLGKRDLEGFAMQMNLRLFGIGATLQSEDGYTVIREIRPGTPAEKSKQIKVGDKVVAVAQGPGEFVDVIDEKLSKVVEQIRGAKGTEVRLLTIPSGADSSVRKVVSIVRDEIKLEDQEAKSKLVEFTNADGKPSRVGVIDLPSFYANFPVAGVRGSGKTTTGDVAKLLKKLTTEGAEGIILDLRRNGGGSLPEAINLAGLFIKSGPVVQIRNFDGTVEVDEDTDDSVAYDGPLLVLTSRFSASASEIVAAALQDYGRAVVVGDATTHGKGTVQTVQELAPYLRGVENAGALKVTIRKFYRASGGSTQLKGVTPDLTLPSINDYAEVGEGSLDNALIWDTIPGAKFDKLNRVQPWLPELAKRSSERIAADRDFAYVNEDIARFRKALADKSVSLNEARRRTEKAADKARVAARKKELAERHEVKPKTWEITLKLADKPGLPPAMTNDVVAVAAKSDAPLKGVKGGLPVPVPGDASGTNRVESAAALQQPRNPDDAEEEDLEETGIATDIHVDPHLKEAERILIDLIRLSSGKPGMAASRLR